MFVTKCIVLKRKILNGSNVWYTLLSRDFGKINVFGKEIKKTKPLDIGMIVTMRLKTKAKVSTLTDYDIFKTVPYHDWNLSDYNSFLKLLNYLNLSIPFGITYENIFDGYLSLLENLKQNEYGISGLLSTCFLYKMIFILGILQIPEGLKKNSDYINISKKLSQIKSTKIIDIKTLDLPENILYNLDLVINYSYKDYITRSY